MESKFFDISELSSGVNSKWCKYIFIWMCQSTGPLVCCVCLCISVCDTKPEYL